MSDKEPISSRQPHALPPTTIQDEGWGFYEKLVRLPLFTGMSRDELGHVVEKTKFLFKKADKGCVIAQEGDPCGQFVFLIDGRVEMETWSADHSYCVFEEQKAFDCLQPEATFGVSQRFTHTFRAMTCCSLISINKTEVLRLASSSLIFRLNLLNLISTSLQKQSRQAWWALPRNLEERVCRFFSLHCRYEVGRKVFKIKMNTLAALLNDNRLHISQCLNELQTRGQLLLSRGTIVIPALEKLLQSNV